MGTFSYAQNDTAYFKFIIQTLAHDSMQGRAPGTIYETKAANFIIQEIEKIRTLKKINNLQKPRTQNFKFLYNDKLHYGWQKGNGKNIYCKLNNNADSTILISAHYDHLGTGNHKSLSYSTKKEIHNGADDNASGVALALALLNTNLNKKYNYVFVFYSAHELGLYGSADFEKFASKKFKNISLLLNFDMLGRLDKKEKVLTIYGYNSIQQTDTFFKQNFKDLKIVTNENDKIYETDARPFAKKIKCLSFTTGTHLDYHKPTDDEKYINYAGINSIKSLIEKFILEIK